MKTIPEGWWSYWNNDELLRSIKGNLNHKVGRFLLWKYESFLESEGKKGYGLRRFDTIEKPELEHISPRTEPIIKPHGYDVYDDEFNHEYLNCIGNFLVLSKTHNASASNDPFLSKLADYRHLAQQREIVGFAVDGKLWLKESITKRKEKIVNFIMSNF